MTALDIYKERFVILSQVLKHTHNAAYLGVGQKIMIHQERANLLQCITATVNNKTAKWLYHVPDHIEEIIERVVVDNRITYSDELFESYINL